MDVGIAGSSGTPQDRIAVQFVDRIHSFNDSTMFSTRSRPRWSVANGLLTNYGLLQTGIRSVSSAIKE